MTENTFSLNSVPTRFEPGETVLTAARREGVFIPTLCHDDRLKPYGGCRLCLVEIEGGRCPVPACATKISPGMVVTTESANLDNIRRTVLELLLSDHDCHNDKDCQLCSLARKYRAKRDRFAGETHVHTVDERNPFIIRDFNKCILCGRCSRICSEIETADAIEFVRRGFDALVTTPYDMPLSDTSCEQCGQCVSTCPTGALSSKPALAAKGKKSISTICPYCGCGCSLDLEVTDGKLVNVTAAIGQGVNNGNLCVKGRFGFEFVQHPDRLTQPLVKKGQKFTPVSWDEAYDYIHDKVSDIISKNGANAVGGLASAKCTNEDNYIFQKFIRGAIGTNNVDHCARL